MVREATQEEKGDWNNLVKSTPSGGHIQQSVEWSHLKQDNGWQPSYLIFESKDIKYPVLLIKKSSKIVKNSYVIARGPGFCSYTDSDSRVNKDLLRIFTKEIKEYIKNSDPKAALLVFQPWFFDSDVDLQKYGFIPFTDKSETASTIFVSLKDSEDKILSNMKKKTRYGIKSAAKKGVTIKKVETTNQNMQYMYNLMLATQERAGFFLRKKEYFFNYWNNLSQKDMGGLFYAYYEGEVIAGAFVSIFGTHAIYKDGGSLSEYRDKYAPYLLQWHCMKWAKSQGAQEYDMGGVPPSTKIDRGHLYAGMYDFKKKFESEITDFCPTQMMPIHDKNFRLHQKLWRIYNSLYIRFTKNIYY